MGKSVEGQNKEMVGWGLKNPVLLFCLNLRPGEAWPLALHIVQLQLNNQPSGFWSQILSLLLYS